MDEVFDCVEAMHLNMGDVFESPGAMRRKAFRASFIGASARLVGGQETFMINDISSGGLRMSASGGEFGKGDELHLDILVANKIYIHDLPAKVVRVFDSCCACSFFEPSRAQELKLDKLVLEMQKKNILQKKLEREAEEKLMREQERAAESEPVGMHELPPIKLKT